MWESRSKQSFHYQVTKKFLKRFSFNVCNSSKGICDLNNIKERGEERRKKEESEEGKVL